MTPLFLSLLNFILIKLMTVCPQRECTRSGFCNFMHLKPISRELRRELYGRRRAAAIERRLASYVTGRSRSRSLSPIRRRSRSPRDREKRKRSSSRDKRERPERVRSSRSPAPRDRERRKSRDKDREHRRRSRDRGAEDKVKEEPMDFNGR
jgi:hypothetical protein